MKSVRFAPLAILVLAGAAGAQTPEPPPSSDPYSQAAAAYDVMDWPRCAEGFTKAAQAATTDYDAAKAYFQAAACTAAKGDKDAAFALLDKAAGKGFRDLDRAILSSETAVLATDPRWMTFLEGIRARSAAHTAKINAELTKLYQEDQADRANASPHVDPAAISRREAERRKRVVEIMSQSGTREADDYFHAAMVLHRSERPEDLQRAHDWSLKILELDPEYLSARWLAATSHDRLLMSQGKPQLYGTQVKQVEGKWILWEVDPSITDQERAKWDVPPLSESKARVEKLNRGTSKPQRAAPKADPHATSSKDL